MDNQRYPGGTELLDAQYILKDVLEIAYGSRVADLGVGSMAFFALQAAKLVGDKGRVYACDILKDVLSAVEGKARQEGLLNIKTIWTNLEIVGAAKIDEPVDYALLINILFQSQKHVEILQEASRLLKPEGKLLMVEWKPTGGPIGPAVNLRISQADAERLATEAGFTKIKEFEAGANHYGLVFQK
ncbi:MAG: methyltransferase domain-containing protein [Patescibacteria group bacterium]|jgi:ubiquinone/menaquinone biosynthesis C-methylase UbiE